MVVKSCESHGCLRPLLCSEFLLGFIRKSEKNKDIINHKKVVLLTNYIRNRNKN